jgi:hypothetical protein
MTFVLDSRKGQKRLWPGQTEEVRFADVALLLLDLLFVVPSPSLSRQIPQSPVINRSAIRELARPSP